MLCIAFGADGHCFSGAANGQVYKYGQTCSNAILISHVGVTQVEPGPSAHLNLPMPQGSCFHAQGYTPVLR